MTWVVCKFIAVVACRVVFCLVFARSNFDEALMSAEPRGIFGLVFAGLGCSCLLYPFKHPGKRHWPNPRYANFRRKSK